MGNNDFDENLFHVLLELRRFHGGHTYLSSTDEVLQEYNTKHSDGVLDINTLLDNINYFSLQQKTPLGSGVLPFDTRKNERGITTHIGLIDRAYKEPSEWSER